MDINKIRADFPILFRTIYDKPLVYLDNGASSQKPKQVIDAIQHYYAYEHSNIHRGVHHLSAEATSKYENARKKVQAFINAKQSHEIIFTKGTTDAINLVASSFGKKHLQKGDEILISTMEHHSNIVPWQLICEEKGAILKVIPINDKGELILEEFDKLLCKKTKIVAISHVSNTLGTINPIEEIIKKVRSFSANKDVIPSVAENLVANSQNSSILLDKKLSSNRNDRKNEIAVLIDGAQAVPHTRIDVQQLDCDFYAFSGHKMYGPTGVGVLYGKEQWLNDLPPYQGGGDMINKVTFEKTTYNELPHKFEAGTPNIAGGIGLGYAIDYMNDLGIENIAQHEHNLLEYATEQLLKIEGLRIIGTATQKASVISFLVGTIHPYDLGTLLDRLGIAIRTGHHCTEPLMNRLDIPGTCRASFGVYNTPKEIDVLVKGIMKAKGMLA